MLPSTEKRARSKLAARNGRSAPADVDRGLPISLVRDDTAPAADSFDAFELHRTGLSNRSAFSVARVVKRSLDIVIALVALVIAAPVILVIAVAIKLESRGSVFFAHSRLGRGGGLFSCWKFRSMHEDAESRLHADEVLRHHYVSNHFKIPHHLDPRITPLGSILRKTSLDELPQLWNVLCGDMSLVGPRPIVPLESSHYGDEAALLLSVRPGLTGAWAVAGRNRVGYPMRAKVELDYVKRWTLATDLLILARTPHAVVTQSGVH